MARTRSTPAPALAAPQAPRDEDEVDYGEDSDLTDVSELERQLTGANLNEPPSAQPAQAPPQIQIPATPAPGPTEPEATATNGASSANTVVALPAALVASMTNTMNALAAHLGTLNGSHVGMSNYRHG
jgi:hypothetical protein